MKDLILELRNDLKGRLTPSRFEHTVSVSFICTALAMCYGCDLNKAELAGLLHDCAKPYGDDEIIRKCRKQNLPLTDDELKAPMSVFIRYLRKPWIIWKEKAVLWTLCQSRHMLIISRFTKKRRESKDESVS